MESREDESACKELMQLHIQGHHNEITTAEN